MSSTSFQLDILKLFLPEGILEHFDITGYAESNKGITIFLDENKTAPSNVKVLKAVGFTDPREITDFPIRGKLVTLSVRRRRWLILDSETSSEKKISRDWTILKQGTSITAEFAVFLKGIS